MRYKNQLGCFTWPAILATVITFFVITGTVFSSGQGLFSPGPLNSQPGAPLGNISSHAQISGACDQCHAAPWEADFMQDRCLRCHADIQLELPDAHKLHGILLNLQDMPTCAACHPEHRGPAAALTEVTQTRNFPHELLGFATTSHKKFPDGSPFFCQVCHATGYKTFASSACADCHIRLDRTFMVAHLSEYATDCLDCHDGRENIDKQFKHTQTAFSPVGAHTEQACANCHSGAHLLADFKASPAKCADCHLKDNPHTVKIDTACEACHQQQSWENAQFDHAVTGFALAGQHSTAVCEKCHTTPGQFKNTPPTCFGCHQKDDKHTGSEGTACENCHTVSGWKPSTFNHDSAAFQLTGMHASVQCAQCHTNGTFKNTPTSCYSCHQKDDKHAGSEGISCENCHTTTGWKSSTFNHSAVFTLAGAHTNLACAQCHTTPFKFNQTPTTCSGCHQSQDVHAGTEGTACKNCHTNSSWKPSTFDHNNAVFPLTGAHIDTLCAKCHNTPGMFRGTPQDCYACHAANDPHAGAFGASCGECHATPAWKPSTFDHNQTSFPLTGTHQSQPCAACHSGGVFKGTPSTCASCHTEPVYHAGLFGANCAACHSTADWNATYTGPHNFPIQHGTSNGTCATCHPSTLAQWTCYNCHDQAQTATHHAEQGLADITNCLQCHPAGKKG